MYMYDTYIQYIYIHIYNYTSSIFGPRMESPTTSSKKGGHVQMINATRHWFFGLGPGPFQKGQGNPSQFAQGTNFPKGAFQPPRLRWRFLIKDLLKFLLGRKLGNSLAMLFSKEKGLAMYLVQFWEWWF